MIRGSLAPPLIMHARGKRFISHSTTLSSSSRRLVCAASCPLLAYSRCSYLSTFWVSAIGQYFSDALPCFRPFPAPRLPPCHHHACHLLSHTSSFARWILRRSRQANEQRVYVQHSHLQPVDHRQHVRLGLAGHVRGCPLPTTRHAHRLHVTLPPPRFRKRRLARRRASRSRRYS